MKDSLTFTSAVLRWLAEHADSPETVREWMEAEPDPDKRAVSFACALREDLGDALRFVEDPRDPHPTLLNSLLDLALRHVRFRSVAEGLLARFAGPEPDHVIPPQSTISGAPDIDAL